ncbi:MAG: hypothetical protein MPI95_02035 [Nitrosopumilus sp.]|nr:hypothetical protein [Nitrosopumilus sp.]CAI9831128.1 conserved exported hypothetical protein [Nitrosopumilaceae archaeon]MDA7941214.1 hypothetical protein [Nitrosopumilus sp.]MDA7942387.1 hypothetical protein [Nitrosopumilus sp.]MDA7944891.1 hypothetical protein [Nitrosopumilus sp.]
MRIHAAVALLLAAGMAAPAYAHTTVVVGQYEIEAGWGTEPPIVGIRNQLVFKVIERGESEGTYSGITGAFTDIRATAVFGGATKEIVMSSDPRPGYYFSPIIPTKTGSYMVELEGQIQGTAVSELIPIEDVEPTSLLDFPPAAGAGSADVEALKNAVTALQQDVRTGAAAPAAEGGAPYDIAILGLSISGAAIVLSAVALARRRQGPAAAAP